MRTVRTLVAAAAVTALGLVGTTTVAQAEPVTEELTVICDGIGDDTITVTGDLADGGTATLPADGPLTVVGEPGFTGRTAKGAKVEVEPTGEGVTCTAQQPATGDLDEIVPEEQADTAPTPADTPVQGALTFTVTVDEESVNAAAQQRSRSMTAATTSNRFPFESELRTYLAGRPGATGVAVRIPGSGEVFRYTKTSARNVTASIVKVEIMAGVMLKAQDAGRGLTSWEKSKIVPMIRNSDNAATTSLYTHIGRKNGLTRVSQRLGLTQTISDPADHWGLTSTVPEDQALLMEHFTRATGKLTATNRSYGMTQMRNIHSAQDWGVTAGPPSGTVALKNGWLPRTDGWHVNSIGAVQHSPYHYSIGVLTHDGSSSGTQSRQVSTIEGVSRIIHGRRADLYEAAAEKRATRVGGDDRYDTAARVSAATFSPGMSRVYVASGEDFPDALAGAPLAAAKGAPVLLTRKATLPGKTANELRRLRPETVVVLGGTASITSGVKSSLGQYATMGTDRIAGEDRHRTAVEISRRSHPSGATTVFVASSERFPDALAAGPAAHTAGAPLLLTKQAALNPATAEELSRLSPTKIVVVGGSASIATEVIAQIVAAAPSATVERWYGADRYATARQIAVRGGMTTSPSAWVASGAGFPDALAASPAAAAHKAPIYLTQASVAPGPTMQALAGHPLGDLYVVGGRTAISSATYLKLSQSIG